MNKTRRAIKLALLLCKIDRVNPYVKALHAIQPLHCQHVGFVTVPYGGVAALTAMWRLYYPHAAEILRWMPL